MPSTTLRPSGSGPDVPLPSDPRPCCEDRIVRETAVHRSLPRACWSLRERRARVPLLVVSAVLNTVVTPTPSQRATALKQAPPAVVVREAHKSFVLPHQRYSTLKERVLHPFALAQARRAARARATSASRSQRASSSASSAATAAARARCSSASPGSTTSTAATIDVRRTAVAVHRAGRGLQPRPDRARQRPDQRDHARPHAQAGARADSTRSSSSPSSRTSST